MGSKHMNSLIDFFGATEVLRNEPETEAQVLLLKAFSVFCILKSLQPPFLIPSKTPLIYSPMSCHPPTTLAWFGLEIQFTDGLLAQEPSGVKRHKWVPQSLRNGWRGLKGLALLAVTTKVAATWKQTHEVQPASFACIENIYPNAILAKG